MKTIANVSLKIFALFFLILPQAAFGYSLTASYGSSTQSAGYEKYISERASGTFSFNLGMYFRVDLSYGQEYKLTQGYKESTSADGATATFQYFESRTKIDSLGANLSIILYNGDVFVPYIFGGVARNTYDIRLVTSENNVRTVFNTKTAPIITPAGGFGLAIMFNRSFSLKLAYTLRNGIEQLPGEEKARQVTDSATDIGLTYHL